MIEADTADKAICMDLDLHAFPSQGCRLIRAKCKGFAPKEGRIALVGLLKPLSVI